MIRDLGEEGRGPSGASGAAAEGAAAQTLPQADLVIVGSGPAGLTLAAELAGTGLRIVVLESGRRRPTRFADALRSVDSAGLTIKDWSRERVLGGTSSTWAGLSAPLDEADFSERPWLALPGWPIARAELLPYWAAAAARYRFAPPELFSPTGFGALKRQGDGAPDWEQLAEKVFLAAAEPQHFGREWGAVCEGPGTDLLLDATVLELQTDGARAADGRLVVARALLATSGGARFTIAARAFVLATGGIENARLLLLSTDGCATGLGNAQDLVGRGMMNHPKHYRGLLRLSRPVRELPYLFGCLFRGYAGYAGLRLAEEQQRERRLLNSYLRFEPLFPWSDRRGVEAFVLLVKRTGWLLSAWRRRQGDRVVTLRDYSETGDDSELQNARKGLLGWLGVIGLVAADLPAVLRYAVSRLRDGRAPPVTTVRLRNFMEQEPHPDNRVALGERRDAFGRRLPRVSTSVTELDRRSMIAVHEALAADLARNGFGTLQSDLATARPWPIDQDASHHLGTTRMGRDPAQSVVDEQLTVHGVANLSCAGGSVFATSGCANPTFTICALSIRLAEHLATSVFGLPRERVAGGLQAEAARAGHDASLRPASELVRNVAPHAEGRRRVLVLGAGRRVEQDVLAALAALPERFEVAAVCGRAPRELQAAGFRFPVTTLAELSDAELLRVDLIHLAVSKSAVPSVLSQLLARGLGRADLLIDTPVLPFRNLGRVADLSAFRRTWVAEDCATLPWIDLVRQAAGGDVTELTLDRSAYRYHALALAKALTGRRRLLSVRKHSPQPANGAATAGEAAARKAWRLRLADSQGSAAQTVLVEPRDYARGHFAATGPAARVVDDPRVLRGGDVLLSAQVQDGRCIALRAGEHVHALSPQESALFGPARADETVTARMECWKRVGLARMYVDIHAGRGGWPLEEGLDDMLVDELFHRFGRWRELGLSSLKRPSGRRLLPAVLRALVRS